MNELFAVNESATWYIFEEYEIFQDSDGFKRIRPQKGSKRISFNPFEYGENDHEINEPDTNLLLEFMYIGKNADNKNEAEKTAIKFVKHYGLLGLYSYCKLYEFVDLGKVYTKQINNCLKLPSVMDFNKYSSLFFDKTFSSQELSIWPENTNLWFHYSERIEWIIEEAKYLWKHLQSIEAFKKAVESGNYINKEETKRQKRNIYYIDFSDFEYSAINFFANNISLGLDFNDDKQKLEISWLMKSLISFIEIIHINKCIGKQALGICKKCGRPYIITSPAKNSGCCNETCRHRFNANKSKAFKSLQKKRLEGKIPAKEYNKEYNSLIAKYGKYKGNA